MSTLLRRTTGSTIAPVASLLHPPDDPDICGVAADASESERDQRSLIGLAAPLLCQEDAELIASVGDAAQGA